MAMNYERIQLHPWPGVQETTPLPTAHGRPLKTKEEQRAKPVKADTVEVGQAGDGTQSSDLISLARVVADAQMANPPMDVTHRTVPTWTVWLAIVWACLALSLGGAVSISYFAWDTLPGSSVIIGCGWFAVVWYVGYWWHLRIIWDEHSSEEYIARRHEWAVTLYRWNYACALAHVTLSIVIARLIGDNAWPVRASITQYAWRPVNETDALLNRTCSTEGVVCKVTTTGAELGFLHAEWIVFSFHMLSGLGHTVVCLNLLKDRRYILVPVLGFWPAQTLRDFLRPNCAYLNNLDHKMNPWRWIEYFFSASLMQVVIMVLTGFTNVWMLVLSASCIAVTQAFGYAAEWQVSLYTECNKKFTSSSLWWWALGDVVVCAFFAVAFRDDTVARDTFIVLAVVSVVAVVAFVVEETEIEMQKWVFYLLGWFAFFGPWLAVYYTFYDSINIASESGGAASKPPTWVKFIIWSLVILFGFFAVVMAWYLKHWKDPFVSYWSEMGYLILSLVAKAALAFQLWYGLVQREDRGLQPPQPFNVTDACSKLTGG